MRKFSIGSNTRAIEYKLRRDKLKLGWKEPITPRLCARCHKEFQRTNQGQKYCEVCRRKK